ncbi:MAG: CvpA family protein [Firmicutes bacterium]|nr:CvpA family protein [Bacillota bacterium]
MNLLDLVIIMILILNMLVGWRQGLLGMLGEMGGLVLGLWLGACYTKQMAGFINTYLVGPAWLLFLLSFLGLFLGGRLAAKLVASIIKRTIFIPGFSTMDRVMGATIGLGIGTILVTFLVSLLAYLPWPYFVKLVQTSEIGQYFWSVAPVFGRFFWQELRPLLPLTPARPEINGPSVWL